MDGRVRLVSWSRKRLSRFVAGFLWTNLLLSARACTADGRLRVVAKRSRHDALNGTSTANNISASNATLNNGSTGNNSNLSNINGTTNDNSTSRANTTYNNNPFLVVFHMKAMWPIDKDALERDLASAFNLFVLTQNYINVTVHVVKITCLWSCPRSKRSLDPPGGTRNSSEVKTSGVDPRVLDNFVLDTFGNNTVIIFVPTYGNGTTPNRATTRSTFKYNEYNAAQGSVLEASAVQVIFAVFQGRMDERAPVDAATVVDVFRKYNGYGQLNAKLKTVDEVLTFPMALSEFLASTEPPPAPPSPSSTLLIPSWAIFLLVFVSFLMLLFIIWITYSCTTGTLKDGGAALLVDDLKKTHGPTSRGPLSHNYNINLQKEEAKPVQTSAPKPTRTIRFDRSTSYDVGLLTPEEADKTIGKDSLSPYKRRESRVQEGAIKKKIIQKKQTNSEMEGSLLPAYKPKFTKLNRSPNANSGSLRLPDIQETPPSPTNDQLEGNNSSSEQSDISGNALENKKEPRRRKRRDPLAEKRDAKSTNVEPPATDPVLVNQLYFQPPMSPYPIFQPLQVSQPHSMQPIFPGYPYQFANPHLFYPSLMPQAPCSALSVSRDGSLKPSQSLAGDSDEVIRAETFRKMARDLVEDAFDDSGVSSASFGNKNSSFDRPTDMEEFRKVLNEAFAFSKPSQPPSS